jgi:SWI/SNF-related matrix-associated actin-dependent regulator of chromatin subfamily A protein 2/4
MIRYDSLQRREREEQRRHEAEAAGGEVSNQSGNAVNASMGDNLDDSQADLHVRVKCTKTGKTLHGEDAPKASQLDAWLETHPG